MNARIATSRVCRTLLVPFLFALAAQAGAHEDGAYRHETSDLPAMRAWMADIDDDRTIRSLSLPGTHGSAARYGGHIAANQTLSVTQQLNGGIRVLDLRLRHIDNVFALHHGPVFQQTFFGDALNEIQAFLQANPSETVFMRVKEEHKPENTSRSFEDTFAAYVENYRAMIAVPENGLQTQLSALRGKLVFLVDFRASRSFGLRYGSFDIQDDFSVSSNWDVYRKWERVKDHFARSNASASQAPASINYLSASGGSFPYFVASGHVSAKTNANRLSTGRIARKGDLSAYPDFPRVSCLPRRCTIAFEGTNILARDYIRRERPGHVGFVLADFPGPDLIKAVADVNFAGRRTLTLVNRSTTGCVGVRGGELQLLPCSGGSEHELVGVGQSLRLGGRCIQANPVDGAVTLASCRNLASQSWTLADGQVRLDPRLQVDRQQLCLDAEGPTAGALAAYPCRNARSEQAFEVL